MSERETIGTINDAARLFDTDAARVWWAIASGRPLRNEQGTFVLHADLSKRKGDLWVVEIERV